MKKAIFVFLLISFCSRSYSQSFENLSFGSDSTLDVITWNIEWFPKNGTTTKDYVREILLKLNADVIAIQEVDDISVFEELVGEMPGYSFKWETSYFSGLAYIYNTETIDLLDYREIFTTNPYWNTFPRSPKILEFNFRGNPVIVINNHWKCCGDGYLDVNNTADEENRRYMAANLLKSYIDENYSDTKVILTGDLNDVLTDDSTHNVFRHYLADPNYRFADDEIANGPSNGWSYPSWPSHLDHFLINSPLFEDFENPSSSCSVIKLENYFTGGWSTYDGQVSDHRPVGLKIYLPTLIDVPEVHSDHQLKIYPNPANQHLSINNTRNIPMQSIQLIDIQGRIIHHQSLMNEESISIDISQYESGIYILTVFLSDSSVLRTTFIKSKQ
jgi:exonuclease III